MAGSPQIDLAQFAGSHASGVVDEREPNEYTAGHVPRRPRHMNTSRRARRVLGLTATLAALVITGCSSNSTSSSPQGSPDGSGMMGGGTAYRSSSRTCTTPASLPGTRVDVTLGDMGMTKMMSGDAPMGARMRLRASTTHIAAGKVSLVVSNLGWRTHELVILPLGKGAAGQRVVGSNGRVSEAGSLGEASRACGPNAGEGIPSGSASWTTITLNPGRYELVCNLRNHYANGMRQAITVS
jgi:uncharacterized cupredoxin-like copper-binding protein